jgi:cytoskeletal protein CcmA (bactofilin family)
VESQPGVLVVSEHTVIRGVGEIRNCRRLEVYGYVEGDIAADELLVHKGGRCFGTVKTGRADVHGTLQGQVVVRNLIRIGSSGSVSGTVQHGQLALELGGSLSAEVRNVPPAISGDLELSVGAGQAVRITLQDLCALDPDDKASDLRFAVTNAKNGFVSLAANPGRAVAQFTQADLEGGKVLFRHDGAKSPTASFEVIVADHAGATSSKQTVKVAVRN